MNDGENNNLIFFDNRKKLRKIKTTQRNRQKKRLMKI